MNTALRRLATVVVVMFLALLAGTTWVQFGQASALNNDSRNVRTLYREYGKPRGPIIVAGQPVAQSTPVDDPFGFQRSYTQPELYSTVTGFYSVVNGGSQLERSMNDVLTGQADSLFWSRVQDLITGAQPQGSSIELTLDPAAQQAAVDALGGQQGAVVAVEPSTGKILAMVSTPGFDPNALATHDTTAANAAYQGLLAADGDPLINSTTSENYPPGSTFKLVTAAAALESGSYTPESVLSAPDVYTLPGTRTTLPNFGGSSCGANEQTTLADALRISCNTAFASLGVDLGDEAIREQADRFGFDRADLTVPMRVAASTYPEDLNDAQTALSAIGQESVRATPVQMAMVASAIANGGSLMTPYLVQTVRTANLDVVSEAEPTELSEAVSGTTAQQLTDMMVGVVQSGSGTSAQISGVQVAGKTGTAQTGVEGESPHAWFTGFAPAEDPQVAVAVIVENGGSVGSEATGGRVAAPVARAVMEAVINP
ncbi:peptidoglycan D,D-transpeptidase FtsI family protein [Cellulomonas pakistanensis]|uniref:Cell division protein FtsI n=1 Tax=Cellulomonas pakistanensis TaxID=992287 RepID=A0A919PAQ5_9CELL|nr:penicillin-binding transpeptidase domain-containing protein [Cellulomonas pakistanensis]GIG34817.1 cell division protein FtsI [Cellulomonas pakistanensis]